MGLAGKARGGATGWVRGCNRWVRSLDRVFTQDVTGGARKARSGGHERGTRAGHGSRGLGVQGPRADCAGAA